MRSQVERAAAFQALHEGPPFVVPTRGKSGPPGFSRPWDSRHWPPPARASPSRWARGLVRLEASDRVVEIRGGLTCVAVDAMVGAATAIRERGDFSGLRRAPPFREWFAGAGSLPA